MKRQFCMWKDVGAVVPIRSDQQQRSIGAAEGDADPHQRTMFMMVPATKQMEPMR